MDYNRYTAVFIRFGEPEFTEHKRLIDAIRALSVIEEMEVGSPIGVYDRHLDRVLVCWKTPDAVYSKQAVFGIYNSACWRLLHKGSILRPSTLIELHTNQKDSYCRFDR